MSIKWVDEAVSKDITPDAPNYENNIRTNFKGFNIAFQFPTSNAPVNIISFPAYIKKVSDSFAPNFDSQRVYGRMDPIPVYQNTTRAIQFDLDIPSNGLAHSKKISEKLSILAKNTYPGYQNNGSVSVISSPPLVRVFFSSFIYDETTKNGILGYFAGPITITHDLTKGVFSRAEGYESYAKYYNLTFQINVLHEYTPGFENGTSKNPINILKGGK